MESYALQFFQSPNDARGHAAARNLMNQEISNGRTVPERTPKKLSV